MLGCASGQARAAALAVMVWVLLTGDGGGAVDPAEPPLTDADYFTFADRVTEQMEPSWKPEDEMYRTGARSIDTIANAAMLTVSPPPPPTATRARRATTSARASW